MSYSTNAPGLPRRQRVAPPSLPRPPARPRGPRWEQQLRKAAKLQSGPGDPPVGFTSGTTSSLEWIVYWCMFKIFAPTRNPRLGPYYGLDGIFRYQKAFEGGRDPGGSLVDFVVEYGPRIKTQTAIRIQTVQFHDKAGIQQQTADRLRKLRIAAAMPVIDLYDYDLLLPDGTAGDGSQAVIAVKKAIGMLQGDSRLALGSVREVRYRLNR